MKSRNLYYVDGHVQVYHGYLAELGKKHVSRQKLCLAGMAEFWVNSPQGLPYFFITAEVNEKMIEMLEEEMCQTSIITNNRILTVALIACHMFG